MTLTHADFIAGETLAVEVFVMPAADVEAPEQAVSDGASIRVLVTAMS